jgi:hypothetical protein
MLELGEPGDPGAEEHHDGPHAETEGSFTMGVVNDKVIRSGWHWQFGWLRRRDLDDDNGYCYEEPDGDLLYFRDSENKNMVYLDQRLDHRTGSPYLCLNHAEPSEVDVRRLVNFFMKIKVHKRAKNR